MFTVSADPTVAVVDAIKVRFTGDATLVGMVTGIYGHVSQTARVNYPYIVIGKRSGSDKYMGAMQLHGLHLQIEINAWSNAQGPFEVETIASGMYVLLERKPLNVSGFEIVTGSVHRELQEVFDEPDPDSPDQKLYRLHQRWAVDVHERI